MQRTLRCAYHDLQARFHAEAVGDVEAHGFYNFTSVQDIDAENFQAEPSKLSPLAAHEIFLTLSPKKSVSRQSENQSSSLTISLITPNTANTTINHISKISPSEADAHHLADEGHVARHVLVVRYARFRIDRVKVADKFERMAQ